MISKKPEAWSAPKTPIPSRRDLMKLAGGELWGTGSRGANKLV
jgi:hypothetical protein